MAYVAAVTSHPGYVERFWDELETPGVRVPLTADPGLFHEATLIGGEAIWLHTYGERFVNPDADRPPGPPRLPDDQAPKVVEPIPDDPDRMPDDIDYDPDTQTLHVGDGQIRPVPAEVWDYEVSGMPIVHKWFGYRKRTPAGKKSSPLDHINAERWTWQTTRHLLDLLHVLGRVVELHPAQADLLGRIVDGSTITVDDLEVSGVLPPTEEARKPPKRPREQEQDTLGL